MRDYTLKNYEEQLNHQVIHMDQAVCYCPEFRASCMMHDYPSRRLQLARSVFKGDLEANDFIANLQFQSILSRQGERWQNFGENPEDGTDVTILSREMFVQKGYGVSIAEALEETLGKNGGHIYGVNQLDYTNGLPIDPASDTALLIDDATAAFDESGIAGVGNYFKRKGESFIPTSARPVFLGFEYFAHGLVDAGIAHLKALIEDLEHQGVKRVIVLSAQAKYMLTTLAEKLGMPPAFQVEYLVDTMKGAPCDTPSYLYAGSFNLRYCQESHRLNTLYDNAVQDRIPTSQEFTPLVKGDVRLNTLTIWQKPLGAEYRIFGMAESLLTKIEEDALRDIRMAGAQSILCLEPTALPILKKAFPDSSVHSYLERLA